MSKCGSFTLTFTESGTSIPIAVKLEQLTLSGVDGDCHAATMTGNLSTSGVSATLVS